MKKILDGVLLDMTEDEIQEMQRIDAENLEQDIALLPKRHRSTRDALLAETDWWVLPDRTATQEQLDYRQALRDITAQDGFPESVTWPVKP